MKKYIYFWMAVIKIGTLSVDPESISSAVRMTALWITASRKLFLAKQDRDLWIILLQPDPTVGSRPGPEDEVIVDKTPLCTCLPGISGLEFHFRSRVGRTLEADAIDGSVSQKAFNSVQLRGGICKWRGNTMCGVRTGGKYEASRVLLETFVWAGSTHQDEATCTLQICSHQWPESVLQMATSKHATTCKNMRIGNEIQLIHNREIFLYLQKLVL